MYMAFTELRVPHPERKNFDQFHTSTIDVGEYFSVGGNLGRSFN